MHASKPCSGGLSALRQGGLHWPAHIQWRFRVKSVGWNTPNARNISCRFLRPVTRDQELLCSLTPSRLEIRLLHRVTEASYSLLTQHFV